MRRQYFQVFLSSPDTVFLLTFPATAQEVVHALCGTVRSINSTNKTIAVGHGQRHRYALQ